MLGALQHPPVYNPIHGLCLRFFNQANHDLYYVTSNPLHNPAVPNEDKARIHHLIVSFQRSVQFQSFYNIIDFIPDVFLKEALDITNEYAVHAVRHEQVRQHVTMRSVLIGNILSLPGTNPRERLLGFALELHILQNLRHTNIVRLLSINYQHHFARYELFFETSIPLSFFYREVGQFVNADFSNMFEHENIPRYILKCIAEVLDHLATHRLILGTSEWHNCVFIGLNGVVRVGNFLRANRPRPEDIEMMQSFELASLGGFFLYLVNRFLPMTVVSIYGHPFPQTKRTRYEETYRTTQAAITTGDAAENLGQANVFHNIPQQDAQILRRCLTGFSPYNDLVRRLELTNVPDMSTDLSYRINNAALLFKYPQMTFETLHTNMPSYPVHVSDRWNVLTASLHFEMGDELHSQLYMLQIGENYNVKAQITNILTELITYDPNDEDPPENFVPDPDAGPVQEDGENENVEGPIGNEDNQDPFGNENDQEAGDNEDVQEPAGNEGLQMEVEIELPLSDSDGEDNGNGDDNGNDDGDVNDDGNANDDEIVVGLGDEDDEDDFEELEPIPFTFEPHELLMLYQWIAHMNNDLVEFVDRVPVHIVPWTVLQPLVHVSHLNQPGDPERVLIIRLTLLGGHRDILPDLMN